MYAELDCLHSLELTYGLGSTKNDTFKVIKSAIFIAVSNHKKIKFLAPFSEKESRLIMCFIRENAKFLFIYIRT